MSKKHGWAWYLYFLIWAVITFARIKEYFTISSPSSFFYHCLIGMESSFVAPYTLHGMAEITSALMLVPLYLYITRSPCPSPRFWQCLFMLKLGLDLWFRPFDLLTIQAIYHEGQRMFLWGIPVPLPVVWVLLVNVGVIVFPAYAAFYLYAFKSARPSRQISLFS